MTNTKRKDPPKESVDENDVEQIEEEEAQAEEEEVLETESPMDTVEQEDAPIPTSAIDRVVLPGEVVGKWMENHPIRIGPGLSQINDRIVVTKAGVLRRPITKYFWVECHQKRYVPTQDDMVIGIITERHGDNYKVDIGCSQVATLSILAFEGASRKNKLNIKNGSIIYCRVTLANKDMEPEVACVSTRNKSEGYGELNDGYMFKCGIGLAYKLLRDDCAVLASLGRVVPFEIAAGMNGRVWINSGSRRHTVLITNAIINSEMMPDDQTKMMVDKLSSYFTS
ncbi:hypothetical protein PROFUN_03139 [Planoprotostelium fungivorum]|uniref:Ribosomal RNA-processing protein 40 n=1 Tax=Planoprotostelium fungivorum TaxID=1890364 RepID=A0A2P6NQB5_9EUKA|nr:hypothetical protein PROFUN_03139 [Planoprotostelium fungivorum]